VTTLTVAQIAQVARAAGFQGDALVTAIAVSCAENQSHDPAELGDTSLEDSIWGPSVGLWQIRSLKKDYGTGRSRDQQHLTDPAFNARSAYSISGSGQHWTPWTMYNNGRYRDFLADARTAAGLPVGTTGAAPSGGTPLAVAAQAGSQVPITVGGKHLSGELGVVVVRGSVDLSTSEVSEITLSLLDPGFTLSQRYRLDLDSILHCFDLPFRVVTFGCGSSPAGATIDLKAHPAGAVIMRTADATSRSDVSPTDYMQSQATACGLRFVGRPSGTRASIGPATITDNLGNSRPETIWEVGQRLANELGYYAFEAAGTFYFAPADWIRSNGTRVQLVAPGAKAYPEGNVGKAYPSLDVPTCTATVSQNLSEFQRRLGRTSILSCDVNVSARIEREAGEQLRPAMNAWLPGAAPRFSKDGWMVTRVSWDLSDPNSPVRVEAGVLASKNGTALSAGDTVVTNDVPGLFGGFGTKSALDFVTIALRQVGDKYIYGVEVDLHDPDPSAFDCSELTSWAAAQAGVALVDGSSAQLAAIRRAGTTLTIEEAKHTRGALLFHPGHVVISLGDGEHTVEAMGRKYGVVQGALSGRSWTAAGKIPGMVYP
jgi:hypothetical protein